MIRYAITVLAAGLAAAPAAQAQDRSGPGIFKSGGDVYRACTSRQRSEVQACEWFLMGAHDMAAMARDLGWIDANTFCLPEGTDAAALRALAVARWREKPESREYSAVSATLNALTESHAGACGAVPATSQ